MTAFDFIFLALIGFSLILGAWRGLSSELLALIAWGVAFLAARQFGPALQPALAHAVSIPFLQVAGAYIGVFVLTLLVLGLLRLFLRELLHAVGLGLADRSLGAVFGVLRGCFIAFLLVLAGGLTDLPRKPWWRDATFSAPLEFAVLATRPMLPERVSKRLHYR